MYYKVKEVSEMVGLSVRMLHHYDKIGLLKPDHVTEVGYRQYSEDDLMNLQQILFLRELDFSLESIKNMMGSPDYNQVALLEKQQSLLEKKVERLLKIIDAIGLTKERFEKGESMSNEERFDSFDMSEIEAHKMKYAKEAEEKWGKSDAYKQSAERIEKFGQEDFKRIQEENNGIYKEIVGLMDQDVSNERVQVLVGALRQGITDNFYDCTVEIFADLGEMYVADPRFTKNLDKHGEGFAAYLSKATDYYTKQNS